MPKSRSGERAESVEHARQRKVRPQLLLGELEPLLLELLAVVGHVPGGEFAAGEVGERLQLVARPLAASVGQVPEKGDDLVRRAGHLRRERPLRVVVEAEHGRGLVPQLQDFVDERGVVPAFGLGTLVGRAGRPRPVIEFTQLLGVGMGHDGHVGRAVESEEPAVEVLFARGLAGAVKDDRGEAGELVGIRLVVGERVRGVEQVLCESRAQFIELDHELAEFRFLGLGQLASGQAVVADRVADDLRCRAVSRTDAFVQRGYVAIQHGILGELGAEFGNQRQAVVVRVAKLGRGDDRVQVRHVAPYTLHAFVYLLQRLEPVGGRLLDAAQAIERIAVRAQQPLHRGLDVFRLDRREPRQAAGRKQGVVVVIGQVFGHWGVLEGSG